MDSENKFWLSVWAIISIGVIIICIVFTQYNLKNTRMHIQAGYERVTIVGHALPVWNKVK
jgi:hypothetical protein